MWLTFGLVMVQDRSIPLEEGHHITVLVPHSVHDRTAVVPVQPRLQYAVALHIVVL